MESMKLPPEAWLAINTAIGAFTTLGMAIIAIYQVRQNKKINEVKTIVDGPLSVALKSNAELSKRIADMTDSPADLAAAVKAKNIEENRQEGKEEKV